MNLHAYWESLPRRGWPQHAACRGMDPEPFFDNNDWQPRSPAKQVCERCPVIDDCLAWTLSVEAEEDGHRHGVFGGMNPRERRKFHRLLRRAGIRIGMKVAA